MHFEERKYHLLQNITFNRDAPLEALNAHSYSFFLFLYFSVQDGGGFEVVCFFLFIGLGLVLLECWFFRFYSNYLRN